MHTKPETCKPCPLYGDGKGYVPGVYPKGARVLIAGQNPGGDEEKQGEPFVGTTGETLRRIYLPLLGVDMSEVARDNVIRCRWQEPGKKTKGNKLPTGKALADAIRYCAQYDQAPETLELIIAQGAVALKKYGPGLSLVDWRGHLLPEGISDATV